MVTEPPETPREQAGEEPQPAGGGVPAEAPAPAMPGAETPADAAPPGQLDHAAAPPPTQAPGGGTVRRVTGRPVLGAIFGLLFGLFLTFDLLMLGAFALESVLVLIVPIVLLVLGGVLGWFAPLRYVRR